MSNPQIFYINRDRGICVEEGDKAYIAGEEIPMTKAVTLYAYETLQEENVYLKSRLSTEGANAIIKLLQEKRDSLQENLDLAMESLEFVKEQLKSMEGYSLVYGAIHNVKETIKKIRGQNE